MIYAFTGKTGSGKTYQMTLQVYERWLRGENVYSNTILLFEKFGGHAGSDIITDPQSFSRFERISFKIRFQISRYFRRSCRVDRRGTITYFEEITEILDIRDGVIMIDEGQALFDSRNWESMPDEFANKLRQHRKHSLDLYVTTQNLGTIDINYRRLVQVWQHCTERLALFGIRNPSLISLHSLETKDIDRLYNNVDDLLVPALHIETFYISRFWTRRLYDTLYDVGFKRFRIHWLKENNKEICLIIPKKWSLSHARQHILQCKFYLDLTKSKTSKTNSRNYATNFKTTRQRIDDLEYAD